MALIDGILVTPAEDRRSVTLEVSGRSREMPDFGHKKTASGYPETVWYVGFGCGDLH